MGSRFQARNTSQSALAEGNAATAPANAACEHERMKRTPLYIGGRPTYRCEDCGALAVDESVEPSTKALAPLKGNYGK